MSRCVNSAGAGCQVVADLHEEIMDLRAIGAEMADALDKTTSIPRHPLSQRWDVLRAGQNVAALGQGRSDG